MARSASVAEPWEEQDDLEPEERRARKSETSPRDRGPAAVRCAYCGESMAREQLPRFNRGFGIVVLILGLVLSIFMLLLGLPLVVIGAYLAVASRSVWACGECGAVVDRNGT